MTTRIIERPRNTGMVAPSTVKVRDIRGYGIFSHGDTGEAHACAHRLTDTGRYRLGHQLLGEWLDTHGGQGSDRVHLQFHMAIFELALGKWNDAHRRFLCEVLPTATRTGEALTDAPALLWRIALSAPRPVALPWEPVRRTALAHMHATPDPFVQLHHLLALAGAGDTTGIEHWLRTGRRFPNAGQQRVIERFAHALCAMGSGACGRAADLLHAVLPDLCRIGGSQAQNQLFGQLAAWATRQAENASPMSTLRHAA